VAVIFAALTGAILWNYTTWWLRLPTSSSHGVDRSLVGAGLAKGGLEAIKASSVQKAALFILISPVAGLLVAAGLMWLLNWWLGRHEESGNEAVFKAGQLVSSAAVSLGHGTNDAQKSTGVIAALLGCQRPPARNRRQAAHPPVGGAGRPQHDRAGDDLGWLADRADHGPADY
jgi:PiT family inorganic phosphate transporter